jgi:hypothetical protein
MHIIFSCILILVSTLNPSENIALSEEVYAVFQSEKKGLFESTDVLELKLKGPVGKLLRDRGTDHKYHYLELMYTDQNEVFTHQIKARTRGNFRRLKSNCKVPPLTLNFKEDSIDHHSIFKGQTKLKLVLPCQDEKYVIREYLVYKLYNLVTEFSFKVRLVRLTMHDSQKNKNRDPVYAFLIEDEDHLVERVNARILDKDGIKPNYLDKESFHKMAVFAFMIGNTDWSIQYRHNIKILYPESLGRLVSVPYDFDLVGMVDAPYADPAPELKMRSVKQRRYRGYCVKSLSEFEETFSQFHELKDEFYNTFTDCALLEEKYIKSMHSYLDDFYEILNDPKKCKKAFLYPCDKYGTGNIVLTGLPKKR